MKKYICGLFDTVSGNVGDICILDNIKEFDWSVRKLLADPKIPDYATLDCCAVVYGELHYDVDTVPYIVAYDHTKHILSGRDVDILRERRMAQSRVDPEDDFDE